MTRFITVCLFCRRPVWQASSSGTWYHMHNGSTKCLPAGGTREATPTLAEVSR